MTLAINAQICPSAGGGIESNLLSMLRSDFWSDLDVDLAVLATPFYAKALSKALDNHLRVVPWKLGEEVIKMQIPRDVARGRYIQERLGVLRPAFDAAVVLYRVARYGRTAPTEEKIDRVLRRMGVHAVHFPAPSLFRTTLPFAYEPWDLQYLHFPAFFDAEELERRQITYRYGCENATIIVTPTRWVKEDVVTRLKIDPRKVVVIRRGSDYASVKLNDAQYVERLAACGIQPGFAFYPGMTFPHKNHMTLFRALAHLKAKKRLRIPLVMTGRPVDSYRPAIERAIVSSDLADQVHALGSVSEATLAALYRGAHAVIFPSLLEGLGLPLVEALKHRTPILAANATCIPEVVGRAGILFDPLDHVAMAEAIERAWGDPRWLREPLQYAEEQLELFDWGRARRSFRALYRKLSGAPLGTDDQRLLQAA